MAEFDVVIKVVSQKGKCHRQHKVSDKWVVTDTTPGGICLGAYAAMLPMVQAASLGGTFPWSADPGTCLVACPDAENPVVFEIRRKRRRKK